MASIKGYVWYSPAEFEEKGYEIPKTLDELTDLSEHDRGRRRRTSRGASASSPVTPPDGRAPTGSRTTCCACTAPTSTTSGSRTSIPFNDPQVAEAFDAVGEYLKNDDMVNGGIGDVSTQVTEAFQTAGLPILDGACSLHHQASFYETFWNPEGGDANTVASDGTVFAFLLPPVNADDPLSVTGGGEFPVAFRDAEEVEAFRTYLSSDTWANNRVEPRRRHQREQGPRPRGRVE